jgi:hypothetical protein
MNRITPFAVTALLLGSFAPAIAQAPAPPPANVCLNVQDIQRTEAVDDRTILFHMRGGKVWRNTLRTACPMLKVSPFTQKVTGDLVCSNAQFIHVNMTGNDCALGEFTPLPSPR